MLPTPSAHAIAPIVERRVVVCPDPAATRDLAAALARVAAPGDVISLIGELGAGKTLFAKGFGSGLGVTPVNAPSFVLMAEYTGRLPLFHLDLYRLADAATRSPAGHRQRQAEAYAISGPSVSGALPSRGSASTGRAATGRCPERRGPATGATSGNRVTGALGAPAAGGPSRVYG